MNALELMARLSLHVPVPRKHKITYHGAYSTRFRGEYKQYGHLPNKASHNEERKKCSKKWRDLIYLVYQDDPLCCPKCGGKLVLKNLIPLEDAKAELNKSNINHFYYRYSGEIKKETLENTS